MPICGNRSRLHRFQGTWRALQALVVLAASLAGLPHAHAETLTYTGTLSDPNQILQIIFNVQTPTNITIQTSSWKSGNFDPVLWLYDSLGNQITKDDDICNGVGCSPANRDSMIQVTNLAPGNYTAILSAWDQHFWRAIAAGNPPGVEVTGWSYAGTFEGLPGNYSLTFTANANITPVTQIIFPPSDIGPDAPRLTSPANGSTGASLTPSFNWSTVSGTNGYAIYIGTTYFLSSATIVSGPPFTPPVALSPNTTYYWKVASRDPSKNNTENPSLVSTFTTASGAPPPPPAPTQISPGNGTTGLSLQPTLTWSASTGTAGYDVYFGTTNPPPSASITNNLSFTPTSALTPGTTYYWKVASRDPNRNNAETSSSVWSFVTAQPLAAPTLLSPANGSSAVPTTTSLSWSAVNGSAGYMVYLGTTNPPTSATFSTSSPFTPSVALTPGTHYFWRVSSRDPNNNNAESMSAVWSFSTTAALGAPTLSSPTNNSTVSSTTPTLSWNAVSGSSGYTVYIGTTNPPTTSTRVTTTSFVPTAPLTAGTTYFWMVASRDPNNNNAEADSAVWSFTVAAAVAAPSLLSPSNAASNISTTPTLTWSAVTGTNGYSVYFGTTNPPTSATQTTSTSFAPTTALALHTTYYWMVASRDANNNNKEADSAVWSFTTTSGVAAPTLISPANAAKNIGTTPTLTWSAVTGTAGYSVYFGTTNPPKTSTQTASTSFTSATTLALNTTYYWMVASRDPNNNNKEADSAVWSFTTASPLGAPTLTAPANGATNVSSTPALTWNAVTGSAGYSVYLGTTNPPTTATQVTTTSFTPSALAASTKYFWMVASRDPNNGNKEAASAVWSFTTSAALAAPVQVAPANGSTGNSTKPVLSWNAVSGSAGYLVYLGTTNPPTTSVQTSSTTYTPTTALTAGATYYWKVSSIDPAHGNKENPSTVWSFTTASGSSSPYGFRRTITIDHTKVPNTDQSSFPLLFSTSDVGLKTTTAGGHVNNSSGFDIIFTSDAAGTQKLDHEIESYSGSSGQLTAWVRLPNLSHTSDTVIYMFYGNPSVTSSQQNKSGVWSNGFSAVYHMADNASSTAMTDATGRNPATLQANSSARTSTGEVGSGLTFNGVTDFATAPVGTDMQIANVKTVSMWVKVADLSGSTTMRLLCSSQDANNRWSIVAETPTSQNGTDINTFEADMVSGGLASKQKLPNNSIVAGNWYQLAVTFNGSGPTAMYLNGKNLMVPSLGQNYGYGTTNQMTFGARNDDQRWFGGAMDEIRISSAVRSADWIATEYNNQSKPSAFYTFGSEIAQ